jgi:hypothetical protein
MGDTVPDIETIIKDYIGCKEKSIRYSKKRTDAEKEYNRLLTKYNGQAKHYSLVQANQIYKTHCEMTAYSEELKFVNDRFAEAEEKLQAIGRILFDATITADILMPPANGEVPGTRSITVTFNEGHVIVSQAQSSAEQH